MVIYSYLVERKGKKSPTFSLLMVLPSHFGPFWVWGMTTYFTSSGGSSLACIVIFLAPKVNTIDS